jgi:formylglycine-generating enzyme required for sulfatase activity
MKNQYGLATILSLATMICLLNSLASAHEKVVVIPLGGAVGDATESDVVKGKIFSSNAGKSLTGTLNIRTGGTIYTNSIDMNFSLIPAGSFVMGSPDGTGDTGHRPVWPEEGGSNPDENQHIVTLTRSFYLQTTEVTQSQWEQVMGSNPSHFSSCGANCPVEMVSWDDTQNFIDALNAKEGRFNCNTTPNTCYSLPTESQWEYAARGVTLSAFYNGDISSTGFNCTFDYNLDKIGWYCANANNTTHPVAQKEPNNWGLYDMSGNSSEWCQDLFGGYQDGPAVDPSGATSGTNRVLRGGYMLSYARGARSASRSSAEPLLQSKVVGFRLALSSGQ